MTTLADVSARIEAKAARLRSSTPIRRVVEMGDTSDRLECGHVVPASTHAYQRRVCPRCKP